MSALTEKCTCPLTALLLGLSVPSCVHHRDVDVADCDCDECHILAVVELRDLRKKMIAVGRATAMEAISNGGELRFPPYDEHVNYQLTFHDRNGLHVKAWYGKK